MWVGWVGWGGGCCSSWVIWCSIYFVEVANQHPKRPLLYKLVLAHLLTCIEASVCSMYMDDWWRERECVTLAICMNKNCLCVCVCARVVGEESYRGINTYIYTFIDICKSWTDLIVRHPHVRGKALRILDQSLWADEGVETMSSKYVKM
ncbi:hypothetical protein Pfo_023648 [Paulownia fortunei]|nr:hypothetical protein Pfo_023648 [Paulownia fortunei]